MTTMSQAPVPEQYTRPGAEELPKLAVVTTTNSKRAFLLGMTLTAAMQQVKGVHFFVMWYPDEGEDLRSVQSHEPIKFHLDMLAKRTNNLLTFEIVPPTMPVAHTKHRIKFASHDWIMNLDDDLVIPPTAWSQLALHFQNGVYDLISLGTVDAVNTRNFPDFDLKEYEHFYAYSKAGKPREKMKHHFFNPRNTQMGGVDFLTQLYICSSRLWNDEVIWTKIHNQFTVKGIRGYDVMLEQLVKADPKYQMGLLLGQEALHMGMENPFMGGGWTSFDEETMRKQHAEHH